MDLSSVGETGSDLLSNESKSPVYAFTFNLTYNSKTVCTCKWRMLVKSDAIVESDKTDTVKFHEQMRRVVQIFWHVVITDICPGHSPTKGRGSSHSVS